MFYRLVYVNKMTTMLLLKIHQTIDHFFATC